MPEVRNLDHVQPAAEEVGESRLSTQEEVDTVDWARRVVRDSDLVAQDGLRQLVTLTTALLAGSAAMLDRSLLPNGVKAACVFCLLGALASALFGFLPSASRLSTCYLDEIEAARVRLLRRKVWSLRAASAFLVFAFACLLGWILFSLTH